MAWLEAHDDIWEHHKTLRLMRLLEISDVQAVGHLLSLWHFILRNAWRDANLEPWGADGVEAAARWRGAPGNFIGAVREVGFLDGFVAHGWVERAGRLVYDRLRKEEGRHLTLTERRAADKRRTSGGQSKATVPYRTVPNPTVPSGFEEFWKAYPRKDAKQPALKAWSKLAVTQQTLGVILESVARNKTSVNWTKDGGQFIPMAATWLNQRRWEDEGVSAKDASQTVSVSAFLEAQDHL